MYKFVVYYVDLVTSEYIVGDIPATKRTAEKWAQHYTNEGYHAGVAMVDPSTMEVIMFL